MFIPNQIVGVGGFGIADNLRLIVIAAIFVGIIVVLLYRRATKSGRETNGKHISREKTTKEKAAGDIENLVDIIESSEGTEEKPIVSSETIEEKIKNSETEIIAKFAAVIKDVRAKIDTKLAGEIEGLIAKIEEREKEVINKIENVIDAKVQEALGEMNSRVSTALHTQKNTTASVLEKLVDSLRTEGVSGVSLNSEIPEDIVEEKNDLDGIVEASVKDLGILEEPASSLQVKEGPVVDASFVESKAADEEAVMPKGIDEEEFDVPSEDGTDVKLEAKDPIASPGQSEGKVSAGAVGAAADFDMQAFLDEDSIGISLPDESSVNEDVVEELPEKITEELQEEASGPPEVDEGEKIEKEEPIASSEVKEKNVLAVDEGDTADFDIQEFLEEIENIPSEKGSEDAK